MLLLVSGAPLQNGGGLQTASLERWSYIFYRRCVSVLLELEEQYWTADFIFCKRNQFHLCTSQQQFAALISWLDLKWK